MPKPSKSEDKARDSVEAKKLGMVQEVEPGSVPPRPSQPKVRTSAAREMRPIKRHLGQSNLLLSSRTAPAPLVDRGSGRNRGLLKLPNLDLRRFDLVRVSMYGSSAASKIRRHSWLKVLEVVEHYLVA